MLNLAAWKTKKKKTKNRFQEINFNHIYWEFNTTTDGLSKYAISLGPGHIHFEELDGDIAQSVHLLPVD